MPNWVYNNITITGDSDELEKFSTHIAKKPKYTQDNQGAFSFHSFVTLPDEVDPDEYHGINGWKGGEKLGDSEYNWYNWNNANWFTKWDASDPDVHIMTNAVSRPTSISLTFSTAWAPPEPVFVAMSTQFPTLTFGVHWEEEQGFGAELEIIAGSVNQVDAWDIPSSHAEHIVRDKECVCAWDDDPADWYDDCPRDEQTVYVVESITKHIIKANSPTDALLAAEAEDAGNDAVQNTEIIKTMYSEEYRVKEMEQDNGTTESA